MLRNIRLVIEYDGSCYQGWQSQKSGRTIQDILSKAVFGITGEKVRMTGASRTDAGVHALGQVAAFATSSSLSSLVIKRALNASLPSDIRILETGETDSDFHPRFHAKGKHYFYLIAQSQQGAAFFHRYAWTVRSELDAGLMAEAAACLVGEHDFASFRASGCGSKTSVRHVYDIRVASLHAVHFMTAELAGKFLRIDIEANAFLRHMVRNIVGTLVGIGRGKIPSGAMKQILTACDRKAAGPAAPARGLFLDRIIY